MFNPGDKIKRTGISWGDVKNGQIYTFVKYITHTQADLMIEESVRGYSAIYWELAEEGAGDPVAPITAPEPVIKVGTRLFYKYSKGTYTVSAVEDDEISFNGLNVTVSLASALAAIENGSISIVQDAPFVPKIGVVARIKAQGPWATKGIPNIEVYAGKVGTISHFSGGTQFRIQEVSNQWWFQASDLEAPDGYVPPTPRKIKIYNAEKRVSA